jgi:hypothetical protein
MKTQVIGIEISEGMGKTSGKAYSMGTLHTMTELAPPFGQQSNVAKGYSGDRLECDVGLLRKVQHLSFPLVAEVDTKPVMRFGKRVEVVTDVRPLEVVKKVA